MACSRKRTTRASNACIGVLLLVVCATAALDTGCGDNELGLERRRPNRAPDTFLSSGPPDSTSGTDYRVHFFWSARDADGTIDHYDFIMVDHPPAHGSISGSDSATTVLVTVPRVDDPRWTGTNSTDSMFVTRADTLRRDPQPGEGEDAGDVLRVPFERWHTLFVRAVDDEGTPDPTPDYRSFNALNFAPTVALKHPVVPGVRLRGPPVLVMHWDGRDPLGDGNALSPVASRWVLIPSDFAAGDYTSWPDSLYPLPSRYEWSSWRAWGASDSSGVEVVLRGLLRIGEVLDPPSGYYIFAVQARDEAGAVTPVFDYETPNLNNAALIRVDGSIGPTLVVSERFLGSQIFRAGSRATHVDIAVGQPVSFRWSADASTYGGRIVGYRFGWDLRDPEDDAGWSSWSASRLDAPSRSFTFGTHRFYLQVRDNAESVTSAEYVLDVHIYTGERDVLWVDDGQEIKPGSSEEVNEDGRWIRVLSAVADEHGLSFNPDTDVYDVSEHANQPPPITLVFEYKSIVWHFVSGNQLSGLEQLALFRDPFAPRHQNAEARFNYLNVFSELGGSLWISGVRPAAHGMWPEERAEGKACSPVNVTNWNDPIEPHPLVDSAGVESTVYKMGVELFDNGSVDCPRGDAIHFCMGLRRANGIDPQSFDSSENLEHTHQISLWTTDIESPNPAGQNYMTTFADLREDDPASSHRHTVHASYQNLVALLNGATVLVGTGAVEGESSVGVLHAHEFQVRDLCGTWGAPLLAKGEGWDHSITFRGRPNVEIYNMPFGLVNENPPLSPQRERTVTVYEYVSGAPQDLATGFYYPRTADRQPVFLLTRRHASDTRFTRAICGFEPHRLREESHKALARFVLVRHFGLGAPAP